MKGQRMLSPRHTFVHTLDILSHPSPPLHTHTHTHRWVGGATTFTHHIPQWMKLGARIVGEQAVVAVDLR